MRITFDNANPGQTVDISKTNSKNANEKVNSRQTSKAQSTSFALPTEYEGAGKSKEDVAISADATDVQAMQNAMTVMSNTMSEKDFAKACEDGVDMSDVSVEDSVTILDKIKLEVCRSGEYVPGFTDTLDKEALKEMTGREDITVTPEMMKEIDKAYAEISNVTEMTDAMKKYFVLSGQDFTIDNLFVAKYSVAKESAQAGGRYFTLENSPYLAAASETNSQEELTKQVEKLLGDLEIEVNDENVEASKWLVENSLLVNAQNIETVKRADDISLPLSEEDFAKVVSIAIADGKEPKEAVVDKKESLVETAVRITDEMEEVFESGKFDSLVETYAEADFDTIHARRVLEEVRLSMTTEANLLLLKSGFSIDTDEMSKYVDALKKLEESYSYKEVLEVKTTCQAIEEIKAAPVSLVEFVARVEDADLETIKNEGNRLKANYQAAEETYEAVGTQVRRDLGDSIRKAFNNVDELIRSTGLEVNDITRIATRILGYNNMEITRENINKIAEADSKLQAVLEKLSPKDTIELIRQGSSPIKMSVDELSEYIENKENSQEKEMEKYSKFLYKLERNDSITPEEREAYIDVYRLLNQIKRGDYAAVGAVVNLGQELNFSNLKQAVASRKHTGMDLKVDSTFGLLVDKLEDAITPDRLKAVSFDENNTLSQLYDDVTKVPIDMEYEKEYINELFHQYKEAMNQPEEVVSELVNNGEVVSEDTLLAAAALMKKSDKTLKKLDEIEEGKLTEKGQEIRESLTDEDSAKRSVEEVTTELKEKVFEAAMSEENYIDVRELSLIHKQMSLVRNYSENEYYKLPIEIDGQATMANIKFVHDGKKEAEIVISLDCESLGHVSSRLTSNKGKINGYISTNLKEAVVKLTKVSDKISEDVSVVYSKDCDSDKVLSKISMKDNDSEVSTVELYRVAQNFLEAISGIKA